MVGTGLAERMLPRFRAGSGMWRWDAADAHGAEMHAAIGDLRAGLHHEDPAELLDVVQRALEASITVIREADDSGGVIGDAIQDLLDLHVAAARAARPPAARLVRWLVAFQFDGRQDLFEVDPVAYAPVLGERGTGLYRAALADVESRLPPERSEDAPARHLLRGTDVAAHEREAKADHDRFTLQHNARRLAVLDRDVDAIIATHVRDGRVAAWLEDAAAAFEEIGRFDLAIDWADRATRHDLGHQSQRAADRWCALLGEHRPEALAEARLDVFRRWPTAVRAGKLAAASDDWAALEPAVLEALRAVPSEAVLFALTTDPREALDLYEELDVRDREVTERLATALEPVDPATALALHREMVESDLVRADARVYRAVAQRLVRMRTIPNGSASAARVDGFVTELRSRYANRPRMQADFDRARLP